MIIQYPTCVRRALLPTCPSLVNGPNMQELDQARALLKDFQKTQEEHRAEITRISQELDSFEPLVSLFDSAWSADHVGIAGIFPNSHSDSCIGWPIVLFYFVVSWFVSLWQERDEYSEEITRMCGQKGKVQEEMSKLAKDSQAVCSFIWECWHLAIGYRSFYGTSWHSPNHTNIHFLQAGIFQ